MALSPLLQTDEIKESLNTAIQERTREERDRESSGGPSGDEELILIRKILLSEIDYETAVTEHGLTNDIIVDKLHRYSVIPNKVVRQIRRALRPKKQARKLTPNI